MNAEQIAKLKWLAEAATSGDQSHESRLARTEQFYKAIGPHTVLSLIALAERTTSPVMDAPDTSQDWAKLDGATAFHLIERHAEDWAETGRMMESWLAARMAAAAPHAQAPAAPTETCGDFWAGEAECPNCGKDHRYGPRADAAQPQPVAEHPAEPSVTVTCQLYGHVIGHCAECNVGAEQGELLPLPVDLDYLIEYIAQPAVREALRNQISAYARAAMAKGGAANCQDNEGEKA